jgi:hypothetical protein
MLFQCSSIEPECAFTSGPPRPALQALPVEIKVEALACYVMAGGAAGPAQDVQHQPAGDISMQVYIHKLSIGYI